MNKRWINSALNCKIYSSLELVSSDHRNLTAKIRRRLRMNSAQTTKTAHYHWSLLKNLNTLWNKFDALQEILKTLIPHDEYKNIIKEAAAECTTMKLRAKHNVPWETLDVKKKRDDVKTASLRNSRNPTNANAWKLKKGQNEKSNVYLKKQTKYIPNQINHIRDSHEDRQSRIA